MGLPMLGNFAYLTLASGFMMTDVFGLRCLLALGYISLTAYHAFQLRPLRIPLAGSLFFVLVNTYFGATIYLERQVNLTEEERDIFDTHFSTYVHDYEFQKIIRRAQVIHASERTRLIQIGDVHENLYYILDGEAVVTFADTRPVHVGGGEFIGYGSFILKPGKSRSSVDALPGCRYVCWNLGEFRASLAKDGRARRGLEVKIGRKVARKLFETSDRLSRTEHQLLVMRLCFGSKKDTVDEALRDAFNKYDQNGSGTITWEEFLAMMIDLNHAKEHASTTQLRSLFEDVDQDNSGEVSLDEFLCWLKS